MWWYNILGDNEGGISHLLHLGHITPGSILLTANLVALKNENSEHILILKRTEWMKFIDYFGLSIETDQSKVGNLNVHFFRIGSIPRPSSGNPHIATKHMDKYFNLEPPTLRLYQLTKHLADNIAPHIASALRDLGVIFDKYILSRTPILAGANRSGAAYSWYDPQN